VVPPLARGRRLCVSDGAVQPVERGHGSGRRLRDQPEQARQPLDVERLGAGPVLVVVRLGGDRRERLGLADGEPQLVEVRPDADASLNPRRRTTLG